MPSAKVALIRGMLLDASARTPALAAIEVHTVDGFQVLNFAHARAQVEPSHNT